MFTRMRDASKVALVALVERLIAGGYRLLDTQFVTDHLRQFGAIETTREQYHRELRRALATPAVFYSDDGGVVSGTPWAPATGVTGSAQSITQMS
jgi:leucyl/phenylalanyl-tRNA--protein transferase